MSFLSSEGLERGRWLTKEMDTYQGQMAEAKGMLAELSKEAREAGADPAWLE